MLVVLCMLSLHGKEGATILILSGMDFLLLKSVSIQEPYIDYQHIDFSLNLIPIELAKIRKIIEKVVTK